jgi:hypothetical protein
VHPAVARQADCDTCKVGESQTPLPDVLSTQYPALSGDDLYKDWPVGQVVGVVKVTQVLVVGSGYLPSGQTTVGEFTQTLLEFLYWPAGQSVGVVVVVHTELLWHTL